MTNNNNKGAGTMTNATTLDVKNEYTIGEEDRLIFTTQDQWWWQCRGCGDAFGPFDRRAAAEADYHAI